jgi:7-carboxy-7-deazaguanine synthase
MIPINVQPIEKKREFDDGSSLAVHSIFYTIQGEGVYAGHPAVFIRLAGCNLMCPRCFVKNTKVRMADGTTKNINDVKVGEQVLSYDEKDGTFRSASVTKVYANTTDSILRVYTGTRSTGNGGNVTDLIYCTKGHPFLVKDKGWTEADELKQGDVLLHYSNSDNMTLFNSIRKEGVLEKLKTTCNSEEYLTKLSKRMIAFNKTDEGLMVRQNASDRMIANNPMSDPEVVVKSFLSRSDRGRKSNTEKKFERIIEGLPVEFVGDGSLVVSHKFPDYKITGQNKLIEVWAKDAPFAEGRDENWIEDRRSRFATAGYELLCVAIPDKGIDREGIRKQVSEYIHNGETVASVDQIAKGSKAWIALAGSAKASINVFNLEVEGTHTYIANGKIVHNCDTDYTSNASEQHLEYIVQYVKHSWPEFNKGRKLVVITGGEPFRQNITPLVKRLQTEGFHVQIETNGTLLPSPDLPLSTTVICSPKAGKVNPALYPHIDAYKYVLDHNSVGEDGLPLLALDHTAKPWVARPHEGFDGPVYLQPMDPGDAYPDIRAANVHAVKESCLRHGHILQLQIHKLIGVV